MPSQVRVFCGGVAAMLLLGACSQSVSSGAPATTAFGANVTRPPTASSATVAPDTSGLGAFVPVVTGLRRSTGPGVDDGSFDAIRGALKYSQNDAEARQRLTAGLAGGYSSTFQGDGNSTSAIQLYQFKDPAGAEDFAGYLKEHAMQGVQNFNLAVPGVPGATGFVLPQTGSGTAGAALFVKGPYLAYVGSTSPQTDVTGFLQQLTRAQYDVLP